MLVTLIQSVPPPWLIAILVVVIGAAVAVRLWLNSQRRKQGATQIKGWATNRTERLLVDFIERPERIKQLAGPIFIAPLHVLGKLEQDQAGGVSVQLRRVEQAGRTLVPVFGDAERVRGYIRGRTTEQVDVMQLPLHALLAVIERDEWLVLNPGDEPTLELSPEQIERIIDVGHIAAGRPRPGQNGGRGGRMLIGEPSEPPERFLNQVIEQVKSDEAISGLHLAQRVTVTGTSRGDPVLLLGVAASSAEAVERLTNQVDALRERAGEPRAVEVHWLGEDSIEATHLREHAPAVWGSRD